MNSKFSKIGFILAVVGSAVGLGNSWKFPTLVGQNGGSAFILLYIILTICVGFTIFLAELYIGKASEKDPINAYKTLAPKYKKSWSMVGFTSIGALLIVSFYSIIIGWIVKYFYLSFSALPKDIQTSKEVFENLLFNDYISQILCFTITFLISFFIVSKGIINGIEKLNVWIMPTLFLILFGMLCYSASMSGFNDAFKFLFFPDFSAITTNSVLYALGMAFFSLSIGAGSIITYSASLSDDTNFVTSTISIIIINVIIGLMMGLIVFTFIFEFGADPSQQGPGLIFISLTTLFSNLGVLGNILAVLFFISLFFAGLTSAVSMIEPFAFYLINQYGFSRKKSLILIGSVVYILGTICILSYIGYTKEYFTFFGKSFFDILDYLASNIIMPLGGLFAAIFVGYILNRRDLEEFFYKYMSKKMFKLWYFFLRYVSIIAVIVIMFNLLVG
ncbi:sodium-dependent transporter, SNF family [Campylobacter blaseri]|uniref:Sodium-dependent transporter n=1 Tax=Campylobacter blaseri TaxID=2042961 RepID=A0A2P8QZK6_9BACT|nr:sodium-dependent transporter [Campylobacter blaseri]PSM51684.1 sodium-dependent transporter [Campylobacter blaseri]PSM53474.1 sodium-dependent transporter [Campylobacter blaseri]QKF86279.1 sodium-dependent transporter, SNF family [Campylobacter blaseri]